MIRFRGRLGLALFVRDEHDIIGDFVRHHFAAGIDAMAAMDNGSIDGTREQLAAMATDHPIAVLDDRVHEYRQPQAMMRLADCLRSQYAIDWIVFADADEFWCHPCGDLKRALAWPLASVLRCGVRNVVGAPNGFFEVAKTRKLSRNMPVATYVREPEKLPVAWTLLAQKPKVIARAARLENVEMGNHGATVAGSRRSMPSRTTVYHFPLRSYAQFERKVSRTVAALEANTSLHTRMGWHARRWGALLERGELEAEYDRLVFRNAAEFCMLQASGALRPLRASLPFSNATQACAR